MSSYLAGQYLDIIKVYKITNRKSIDYSFRIYLGGLTNQNQWESIKKLKYFGLPLKKETNTGVEIKQ